MRIERWWHVYANTTDDVVYGGTYRTELNPSQETIKLHESHGFVLIWDSAQTHQDAVDRALEYIYEQATGKTADEQRVTVAEIASKFLLRQ